MRSWPGAAGGQRSRGAMPCKTLKRAANEHEEPGRTSRLFAFAGSAQRIVLSKLTAVDSPVTVLRPFTPSSVAP